MKKTIQTELENMEAYRLLSIKNDRNNPYQVPTAYFDEKRKALFQILETNNHKVPEHYFETLTDRVMSHIDEQEVSVVPTKNHTKKNTFFVSYLSIAATILILLGAIFFISNKDNSMQSQFTTLEQETFDEKELAFLYDEAESYIFDALYEDLNLANQEQLLDPLFENENSFDSLFYIESSDI